jgi:hypothetical protein
VLEEGVGGAVSLVDVGPLVHPAAEGLVFIEAERSLVDDCWLDDFTVGEDSPGHSVDVIILKVDVLMVDTRSVDGLIAHSVVMVQVLNQGVDELLRNEELEVGLLVNIALRWAPAEDWVAGRGPVDAGLRVDSEELVCVQADELVFDKGSLTGDGAF